MAEVFKKYCLEYIISGLHVQMRSHDCLICSGQLEKQIFEENFRQEEEDKMKSKLELEKKIAMERDFDMTHYQMYKDISDQLVAQEDSDENEQIQGKDYEEEEEKVSESAKKIDADFQTTLNHLGQAIGDVLVKHPQLHIIVDNSMGQIPLSSIQQQNRLSYAVLCLSQSLEKLNPNQKINISSTDNRSLNPSSRMSQASNILVQNADEFLLDLPLHFAHESVIDKIASSIEEAEGWAVVVLTDFSTTNYKPHLDKVNSAISKASNLPKVHIFSFNLLGADSEERKISSFEFFEEIAKLTKGSFTGTTSILEKPKTISFQ